MKCTFDGSVLVRAELVVAMQWFIIDFENRFASLSMGLNEKIEQKKFRERKLSVNYLYSLVCYNVCSIKHFIEYFIALIGLLTNNY